MPSYFIPKQTVRVEFRVSNSRFYGTVGQANTVEDAKAFIQAVRDEMPDASHHVYAFKVGYGSSVTEGMSDDGEPSGTAGPPALAVVRGADIGDIVLVITRYFGGTKLGTGGLVHAYGQTAREALAALETEEKVSRKLIGFDVPYNFYERIKRLVGEFAAEIVEEDFAAEVTLMIRIPADNLDGFSSALLDLSAGSIVPIILDE